MKKIISFIIIISLLVGFSYSEEGKITYGELLEKIEIIKGNGNDLNPDGVMKRQEVISLIIRLSDLSEEYNKFVPPIEPTFKDVSKSSWAYKDIEFAYANNITKGIGNNLFGYGDYINANQFSLFILRVMNYDENNKDFEYRKSYDILMKRCNSKKNIKDASEDILRANMFEILYNSLDAKLYNDDKKFIEKVLNSNKKKDEFIDIMNNYKEKLVFDLDKEEKNNDSKKEIISNFGVNVLAEILNTNSDKNILISPTSIINALAMTLNGADGTTKAQMEDVFMIKSEELNEYLFKYNNSLESSDNYKFNLANSIWINKNIGFKVNESFLSENKKYFSSEPFVEEFNDITKDKINNWVYRNTEKKIDFVLDEIKANAVMYLINALSFDAQWDEIYSKNDIIEGVFINSLNKKEKVQYLFSEERKYLEDENAVGFIKDYKDGKYSFVALLPNKDIGIKKYLKELQNNNIPKFLNSSEDILTKTYIPKFNSDFNIKLNDILISLGISDAFASDRANFNKMGESPENIYIGNVIHKTTIKVDERGTEAGAATVVEMAIKGLPPTDFKVVKLNRPFIYMIVDNDKKTPMFIGIANSINN